MIQDEKQISASGLTTLMLVLGTAIALEEGFTGNEKWYWVLLFTLPLLLLTGIISAREMQTESDTNKNDFNYW